MAKIALLIGVSEYDPGLNPLPGAVKDVDAVKQVLLRPDIGGFVESDVTVLKNPIRQEMEDEIEKLFVSRQKDDLLLLFFSGHGIKDDTGKLYLGTRHTRKTSQGELIRSSAVAASFVHENMERSRSKRQVVILDSCFSGAFAEGLSAKDDGSVNIREQLGGEGRAILTSSSSTQYSFEQEGLDLSIYTHYLIEGITTGEADIDGDGVVSIDELHEYASRKVREIQPAMKPELYAIREGFKIRLTKVPPGDPNEKYAKEVRRYVSRGNVSFVGRKILDAQRISLGLSEVEARAIEDEILAVARQEFREKLQRYEQDFTEAIQQEIPLSEADIDSLRQNLKQIWGLRNEDIQPIEAQVKAKIEAYKQHLQQYEQEFTKAMRQEYPLSEITRSRLQQMQQKWELTAENVTSIEIRITTEIEAYRQKLQQYEQAFNTATQQEYPLSQEKRNELRQQRQNLGLKAEDIAPIESRITAKVEAYQHKLQEYEEVLKQTIQHDGYPLSNEIREELKRYQGVLEIRDEDVAKIEAKVTSHDNASLSSDEDLGSPEIQIQEFQKVRQKEIERLKHEAEQYQQKLQPYEQELSQAIQNNSLKRKFASQREIVTPSAQPESTTQPSIITEETENKKAGILSLKWRRRVLVGSTSLGLVLTSFAPCNTPQLIVGIAVILIGSAIVIFRGELQSLASWRRWAMRLGAVVSLLWMLFYVMAVYSSCRIVTNPGVLVSFMSVPYLLFIYIGRW